MNIYFEYTLNSTILTNESLIKRTRIFFLHFILSPSSNFISGSSLNVFFYYTSNPTVQDLFTLFGLVVDPTANIYQIMWLIVIPLWISLFTR